MVVFRFAAKFIALLMCAAILWPATAYSAENAQQSPQEVRGASGRLLIGVQPGLSQEEVADQLDIAGLQLSRYWPRMAIAEALPVAEQDRAEGSSIAASMASVDALSRNSYAQATFRFASADQLVRAASDETTVIPPQSEPEPNDPLYSQQWAPARIDVVQSWNVSYGSSTVSIAVIDSGYDADHPDIDPDSIWQNQAEADGEFGVDDDGNGYIDDIVGWDWVEDDNQPQDQYGHGTHVLGTVAATTNNQTGIVGLVRQTQMVPLRVLGSLGTGYISDLVSAMDYAVAMNFDIVNLSLEVESDNYALRDAVKTAAAAGIIIVAAAGNGSTNVYWPAAYTETVAVAATDSQDDSASFNNFGPEIDVAAPGVGILSTCPVGLSVNSRCPPDYSSLDGTSMATPHVSALFALLKSLRPELDGDALLDIIKITAEDVNSAQFPGDDDYLGAGRINFNEALLVASSGINLEVTPSTLDPLVLGKPLEFQARASVPAAGSAISSMASDVDGTIPVEGAMVYAQVQTLDSGAAQSTGATIRRKLTDPSGKVSFAIPSPDALGSYRLRVQVGAVVKDLSLTVVKVAANIAVTIESPEMVVGDSSTKFSVRLTDSQGFLLDDDVPIHLTTSAGQFANGSSEMDAVVQSGLYTGTLYAGEVAAAGVLTVSIGAQTATAAVRTLPEAPARIALAPTARDSSSGVTVFTFVVIVTDQFGNSVQDGVAIQVRTSTGQLEPSQTLSVVGGQATFSVSVANSYTDPVTVSASVSGTEISTTSSVIIPHIWMPLLHNP